MGHQISTAQNDDRAPGHWGVVGTVIWGFAISAVFITLQVITLIAVALKSEQHLSERQFQDILTSSQGDGVIISVSTFVTTIVCCALVAVIIKLKRGSSLAGYLAIRTVPLKTFLVWLGGFAVFLAASDILTVLLGRPVVPPFMAAVYASAHPAWLIWVAMVVAAPLFEETFFRGFLLKGLASSSIGAVGAIVLTAVFWAVIHTQYDTYGIATIFCIGLIFGAARMQTGSILVPLAMHAFANVVSTAEAALLG